MNTSDISGLINRLHTYDTPTVCNAFEIAQGRRGFTGFTHGAVCVPNDVIPKLNAALDRLFAAEAVALDPLKDGHIDFETFQSPWADFEKART
ncbi:hypothetical protein NBRC116601_31380 [Cognatishimia sp. WU-CL00825]|uniref:hypothetical protein n=1 Tax=Cognatishimia sp. WU-CL00825 TaxID=3127658 RepID=UPI00310A8BF0